MEVMCGLHCTWAGALYGQRGIHLALAGKSFSAEDCRDVAKEGVGGKDYQRQRFAVEAYCVA